MCQGYESPCRAVPLALVAVYHIFLTVDYWNICLGCIFTIVELVSEQIWGNTSLDGTSMKFKPYVPYMTHVKKRFLATSNLAIFKMAAKKQNGRHISRGCM